MVYTPLSGAVAGQLTNAVWLNLYLRDNINALNGNGVVPTYAILFWPGALMSRPDNWLDCDGAFGVIDLRDRAIIGAGSAYAVHDVGGSATAALAAHTAHSITAPSHSPHVLAAAPSHTISTFAGVQLSGGVDQVMINNGAHTGGLSDVSNHANQALTDTHAHTGTPFNILPPFLALTPIFKSAPTLSVGAPRTWADGDVPTGAHFNADLRDAIMALRQRTVWPSMILMWSGSLSSLPDGYQLCNGTSGTPDMRDRFVLGAGSSYATLTAGGALTLTIPNHSNHVATQADAHSSHANITTDPHGFTGSQSHAGSDESVDVANHVVVIGTNHSAHSGFAVDAHTAHDVITTIPPYISLGYIQLASTTTYTTPRTWADGELVDQGRLNTYMRDNESALYGGQVPIGAILLWHESIASIPANYSPCNGSGGLVDTRNRFVIGAGASYAITTTGGNASQTPGAHIAHVLSFANAHGSHSITQPTAHPSTGVTVVLGTSFTRNATGWSHSYDWSSAPALDHIHTDWTIDAGAAHSAHSAMSLLPPYHALAFIQRVS